jgi:hypothetical protein
VNARTAETEAETAYRVGDVDVAVVVAVTSREGVVDSRPLL